MNTDDEKIVLDMLHRANKNWKFDILLSEFSNMKILRCVSVPCFRGPLVLRVEFLHVNYRLVNQINYALKNRPTKLEQALR